MPKPAVPSAPIGNDGSTRVKNSRAGKTAHNGASPHPPTQNLILAKLPPGELASFTEHAERVAFAPGDVLFERGHPIPAVYFPVSAMISLLTVLSDGRSIEAMTIGCEGMAGISLFLGARTAQLQGVCQLEGEVYRLPSANFLALLKNAPVLTSTLLKYSQFMQDSMAQSAACNGIHLLEQRCARWLLLCADAVGDDNFSLTQEFFAQMLAVRRSGVTTTMGGLQRNGLIATRYGSITIADRDGLERITCECYRTIRDRRHELLA